MIPPPVALRWSPDGKAVELLDQTLLPEEERYLRLESVAAVAEAIRSLRVRGAPAIGIAGAMGLALGMTGGGEGNREHRFREAYDELLGTRPTGRNLGWALDRMAARFDEVRSGDAASVAGALREEADRIAAEDAAMCRMIGEHGLALLPPEGAGVLTHCNAGALATGGIGTALAPVYLAAERGVPTRVYADESRPVLQGARLTAWELSRAGIDVTVLTDGMAGWRMRRGDVDLVITGADRIAANGDVANKIGTYALAVLARHHGIPFYVAAPLSTFDPTLANGSEIVIEERDPDEVRRIGGRATVPAAARVWNPAFDVTPADLITALVTDRGVIRPPYGPSIRGLFADDPESGGAVAPRGPIHAGGPAE